ncbi:hypothetical protein XENOCAPTIV_023040 [Xenoophorus captivus]|uniref:Putative adherens-junction anchoring domain-containing protein n=1 Tax=Xenoophorus captivus TaxID=1517983 RepID=A0ABV0QMN6_9TELE
MFMCIYLQQPAQTSPGSVLSLRGTSVPGSPAAAIDLAALPRDKAILDIERPDLMIYQPHYSYSPLEVIYSQFPQIRVGEPRSLSPRSISPPASPEVKTCSSVCCKLSSCRLSQRFLAFPFKQCRCHPDALNAASQRLGVTAGFMLRCSVGVGVIPAGFLRIMLLFCLLLLLET